MTKPILEIDGNNFSTLEEFFQEVTKLVAPGCDWGHNLDAFNDILRGGFGTPNGGFVLRWMNSGLSRQQLSYAETERQLEIRLETCHPDNLPALAEELKLAQSEQGETVFDWLVHIIEAHGPNGAESEDGVDLVLD